MIELDALGECTGEPYSHWTQSDWPPDLDAATHECVATYILDYVPPTPTPTPTPLHPFEVYCDALVEAFDDEDPDKWSEAARELEQGLDRLRRCAHRTGWRTIMPPRSTSSRGVCRHPFWI